VALLLGDIEDVLGVLRTAGVEPVALEEFQGVKDSRRLLGAVLPGNRPQGVLRRLPAILARDQDGEVGILGRLVLKVGRQEDAGDRVDEIPEVNPFVGTDVRQVAHRLCLSRPFQQRFRTSLVRHLEGLAHMFLQPAHHVPQESLGLGLVGSLRVAA